MTDPRGYVWGDTELTLLIAFYPRRGAQWCAAHLSGRSALAVRLKAHRMGLKRRPVLSIDDALRAFVASRESVSSGEAA